jgi:hypothetical protein
MLSVYAVGTEPGIVLTVRKVRIMFGFASAVGIRDVMVLTFRCISDNEGVTIERLEECKRACIWGYLFYMSAKTAFNVRGLVQFL